MKNLIITESDINEAVKNIELYSNSIIRWAKNTLSSPQAKERAHRQIVSLIAYMKCGLTPPALAPEGVAALILSTSGEVVLPGWVKVILENKKKKITVVIPGRAVSFKLPSQVEEKKKDKKEG